MGNAKDKANWITSSADCRQTRAPRVRIDALNATYHFEMLHDFASSRMRLKGLCNGASRPSRPLPLRRLQTTSAKVAVGQPYGFRVQVQGSSRLAASRRVGNGGGAL